MENTRYALHLLERWGYDIGYEEHAGWGHEDLLSRGRIVDEIRSADLSEKRIIEGIVRTRTGRR